MFLANKFLHKAHSNEWKAARNPLQIPLQHLTQLNPATIWSLEVQIRRKISFPDCLIRFARQMELDVNWHCVSSVQISMDMIRFSAVVHYSETGSGIFAECQLPTSRMVTE